MKNVNKWIKDGVAFALTQCGIEALEEAVANDINEALKTSQNIASHAIAPRCQCGGEVEGQGQCKECGTILSWD